jgi:hypothetical protein
MNLAETLQKLSERNESIIDSNAGGGPPMNVPPANAPNPSLVALRALENPSRDDESIGKSRVSHNPSSWLRAGRQNQ